MGTGYTRNDTTNNIADGNVINAADLDGEFDAIETALGTGGHTHDGTAAEGGPVTVLGPAQDFVVSASIVSPKTDNTLDLGTSTLEFKDLYLDGTAHIDTLDVDENAVIIGNLDVGGNLTVTGTTTFNGGTITLGDAATDNVVFAADVDSSIIPDDDDTYDLGSSGQQWRDIYIDGSAYIDGLAEDILVATDKKIQFRDTGLLINSSTDGQLDIDADVELEITAPTVDINASTAVLISNDLKLDSDAAVLSFGADSEITVTHVADTGLTLTHTGTGDNTPIVLQLKSEENAVIANEVLGSIEFAAGDDSGTDAATVAAGIHAIAEAEFTSTANATKLVFTTGVSETAAASATAKMTLSSAGLLTIADDFMIKDGGTIGVASTNDAITIASTGIVTFKDDILIKDGGTIGSASDVDAMTIASNGQVTLTQTLIGTALDISGDIDVDGTANLDIVDIDGAVDMATTLAVAGNVDFNGDLDVDGTTNLDIVDIDGAVNMATTALVTGVLTTTAATVFNGGFAANADSTMGTNKKLIFRDAAIHISSTADGDLSIAADDEIDITSTLIDVNGNLDVSGTALVTGVLTTTAATVFNGGFASNADSTMGTNKKLIFRDAAIHISSTADGDMSIAADDEIDITSTLIDINGAVDMSSTLGVSGVVTANAGVVVDTMTLDQATLTATGNFIVDAVGEIHLDADNAGVIRLKDGGTEYGAFFVTSSNLVVKSQGNGNDIVFQGNSPAAAAVTYLTLDGGSSGAATFNGVVTANAGVVVDNFTLDGTTLALSSGNFTLDVAGDIILDSDAANWRFKDAGTSILEIGAGGGGGGPSLFSAISDADMIFKGNDGGSAITALTLDMSDAGTATFNHDVKATGNFDLPNANTFITGAGHNVVQVDANITYLYGGTGGLSVRNADNSAELITITNAGILSTVTAGTSNLRLGVGAGDAIQSGGNYNVCVGDQAGTTLTTGDHNTLLGFDAGGSIGTGGENTLLGSEVGDVLNTGIQNVAVGYLALSADTEGSTSVAIGVAALGSQNFTSATNSYNTAVGYDAGGAVSTGVQNTFVGGLAGDATDDGTNNVAVGFEALSANCGSGNVALGTRAGKVSTADNNTFVGLSAGQSVTSGANNTLIGAICADSMQTNTEMTAVGYNLAATSQTGRAREIIIGSNGTGAGSNTVRFITSEGSATLNIDGSDTSWAAASDSRLKKEVADSTVGLEFIKDLRPVTFKWNAKNAIADSLPQYDADSSDPVYGQGKAHHGFIAQEVKTVIDAHSDVVNGHNIWVEDPNGTQQVAPSALVPMLVKAIQELEARIAVLEG